MYRRSVTTGVLLLAALAFLSQPGYRFVVGETPNVSIQSPEDGSTVQGGSAVVLEARASDPQEGELDASQIVWQSDQAGELGQGAKLEVTGLSVGAHEITAAVRDSAGNLGVSRTRLVVERPRVVRRAVRADGDSVHVALGSIYSNDWSADGTRIEAGNLSGSFELIGVWGGSVFRGVFANAAGDTVARIGPSLRPEDGVAEAFLFPRSVSGDYTEVNILVDDDFREAASDSLNVTWGEGGDHFRAFDFHEVETGVFLETLYTETVQVAVGTFDQQDVDEASFADLKAGVFLRR